MPVRIDLWSDVVCPFCWIGKRNLEEGARRAGVELDLVVHAYELNPAMGAATPLKDYHAARFGPNAGPMLRRVESMGAPSGLAFRWDQAILGNTFLAHQHVLAAQEQGKGPAMLERLHRAHFEDGLDVSDPATLARLCAELGVDASAVADGKLGEQVRADEALAQRLRVTGVPFFVLAGKYAVSGAQPPEAFEQALRMADG